jgi:hypothetical protein
MGWSCSRFYEVNKAAASLPALQVRSIVCPRDCSPRHSDFHPKAQITPMAVQKMQVVVQKMQVKQSFSFVLLKQETNVRRKESSHEKVRSMPWEAGTRCPLP